MLRLIILSLFICPRIGFSQIEIVNTGSNDSTSIKLVFDYKDEKIVYDVIANNPYNFLKEDVYKIGYNGNKIYSIDSIRYNNNLYTGSDLYLSSRSGVHTAGNFAVVAYQLIFNQSLNDEGPPSIDSHIIVIENGFEEYSFNLDFGFSLPKISPNGKYIAFSRDEETYVTGFKIYDVVNNTFIYEFDGTHYGINQRDDLFVVSYSTKEGSKALYCFNSRERVLYRKYFEDRGPIDLINSNTFTQRYNGIVKTYTLENDFEKIPLN